MMLPPALVPCSSTRLNEHFHQASSAMHLGFQQKDLFIRRHRPLFQRINENLSSLAAEHIPRFTECSDPALLYHSEHKQHYQPRVESTNHL
jgi:hypothetical protein